MFGNTGAGKNVARRTGCGIKAWAQTVDDDDRHQLRYFAPFLPAMETPQVVRAHDPDESDSRAAGQQPRYRIVSVSRLNDSFEAGDIDSRVMCEGSRRGNPVGQWGEVARVFERVTGCHQPPDAIELKPLERQQRGCDVRLVRRIERSAEQADPHAGRMRRQQALGVRVSFRFHGLI